MRVRVCMRVRACLCVSVGVYVRAFAPAYIGASKHEIDMTN